MGGFFKNATWSAAVTGFRALSGFVNALLAVRLVGVENYGHLAALLSVFVLYLSLTTGFYTILVARLISSPLGEDTRRRAELLSASALITACAIALLIFITGALFWIAPSFLGLKEQQGMDFAFLMMGVLVAVQILAALQAAVIEASGRLDLAMRAQLFGPLVLLIMLTINYILHLSLTALDYVTMLCVAASVDLVLLWIGRRIRLQVMVLQAGASASMAILKELFYEGSMLQAASMMNLFLEPLNKLLLNTIIGPVAVTTYDLAMKVIWGIQGLFGAAMRVFLHLADQGKIAVGQTYIRVISLIVVPALIIHTVGAILLAWVAHHWVNIDPPQLMFFYAIATLSNLGMIFVTPLYISLISRGDVVFILHCHVILALTNIVATTLLVPLVGLKGAAFGLFMACLYNIIALYKRYDFLFGAPVGLLSCISNLSWRISLMAGLFLLAILLGTIETANEVGMMMILIINAVILVREPLIAEIVRRAGFRHQ